MKYAQHFKFDEALVGGITKVAGDYYYSKKDDKDIVLLCLAGFARTASKEKVFVEIANKSPFDTVLLDYAGLGLSSKDNNFEDFFVSQIAEYVFEVCQQLNIITRKRIVLVTHGFGACIASKILMGENGLIKKCVFLSPALDQALLMRYWYNNEMDIKHFKEKREHKQETDESNFEDWLNSKPIIKGHQMNKRFLLECSQTNFEYHIEKLLEKSPGWRNRLQLVNAKNDKVVPTSSIGLGTDRLLLVDSDSHYFKGNEEKVTDIVISYIKD